jgi:hypothetical protein
MSTPPRKEKNPENIFRRGNIQNIRARRENQVLNKVAALAAKQRKRKQEGEELAYMFNQPASQYTTLNYTPDVYNNRLLFEVENKEKGISHYDFMNEARKLQAQHQAANAFRRALGPKKTKKQNSAGQNAKSFSAKLNFAGGKHRRKTRRIIHRK